MPTYALYFIQPLYKDWIEPTKRPPAHEGRKTLRPTHGTKPVRRPTTAKSKWRKG